MTEDKSVRELRSELADVLNAAVAGDITFVTSRGRRIAAVVPLRIALEALPNADQTGLAGGSRGPRSGGES
jgi:prevent-host-death family protein